MIKSLTIKCPECPEGYKINYQNFEKHSKEGFKCRCDNIPYYPYQKLFYLSDSIKKQWYFLPNNGITPISKCTIKHQIFYGLYVVDFSFRLKSQRQIYQAIFKGDSESLKVMRNDAKTVFIKDDLDYLDFHDYVNNDAWRPLSDFILLIKRWNREAFDIHFAGGYDLVSADACEVPRRLGKHKER